MINLDQHEYLDRVYRGAGAVVVVHAKDRMPFPEDEGIYVHPGALTALSFSQVRVMSFIELYKS